MKIIPPSPGVIGEIPSEPDNPRVSTQNSDQDVIESAFSEANAFTKLTEPVSQNLIQSTPEDAQKNHDAAADVNTKWKDVADVGEKVVTAVAVSTGLVVGAFTFGGAAAAAPSIGVVGAFAFGLPLAPALAALPLLDSDVSNAIADGANAIADAASDAANSIEDSLSDFFGW
jgi:hypothetical protein